MTKVQLKEFLLDAGCVKIKIRRLVEDKATGEKEHKEFEFDEKEWTRPSRPKKDEMG